MLDLEKLKQLVSFAEFGTLSRVAEEYHISTPSVTRSMQQLEESMGVPLFIRGKNKIELNETGIYAVEAGRKLLDDVEQTITQIRAYDQRRKTIVVRSCAPAPLWELLRRLNNLYPEWMITSSISQNEEVMEAWRAGDCDIAILPFQVSEKSENVCEFMREKLFVCVPPDHKLAENKMLTFEDINGFDFLLRTELGFWDALCRQKMPASKFLVQTDEFTFNELIEASSLPCFTTDYIHHTSLHGKRINIPITDPEADVTFYLAVKSDSAVKDIRLLTKGEN